MARGLLIHRARRIPFHLIGKGQAWLHFENETIVLNEKDLVVFPRDHQHIISSSPIKPAKKLVNQLRRGRVKQRIWFVVFFSLITP